MAYGDAYICPNPNCNAMVIEDDNMYKELRCPQCGTKIPEKGKGEKG